MWRCALLALCICGCASAPPSPFFGDERYLRFGVDPNQEANEVIESQKARNYPLALRLLGHNFTALGFMDARGRSTAVRIVTARGTVVALDPRQQTPLHDAISYTLLAAPIEGTHDADGDSFEEVFVEANTQGRVCLQVYRVRDVGFVDPVELDTQVMGQPFCAEATADLDGDGRVELVGELEIAGFATAAPEATTPRLQLPLWAAQHRFVARSGSSKQRAWLATARSEREVELADARRRLDVERSMTVAVELAAIAHLGGDDAPAQLRAFDRALSGLVLTNAQAAAGVRARGRIYADWNAPRTPQQAPKSEPTADEVEAKRRNSGTTAPTPTPRLVPPAPAPPPSNTAGASSAPPKPQTDASASPKPAAPARALPATSADAGVPPAVGGDGGADPLRQRLLDQLRGGETNAPTEAPSVQHGLKPRRYGEPARTEAEPEARTSPPAAASPSPPKTGTSAARAGRGGAAAESADPDLMIHPETGAPRAKPEARVTPASPGAGSPDPVRGQIAPPAPPAIDRARARELGNAAVTARRQSLAARQAADAERQRAHELRLRAASAPTPQAATELRAEIAQHIAEVNRHVAEAERLAAEAARLRAELAELKGTD